MPSQRHQVGVLHISLRRLLPPPPLGRPSVVRARVVVSASASKLHLRTRSRPFVTDAFCNVTETVVHPTQFAMLPESWCILRVVPCHRDGGRHTVFHVTAMWCTPRGLPGYRNRGVRHAHHGPNRWSLHRYSSRYSNAHFTKDTCRSIPCSGLNGVTTLVC